MARKDVSRARKRDLDRPDEFISFTSRFIDFVLGHKIQSIIVVGVIFLFALALVGVQYISNRNTDRAFTLMDQGMEKYKKLSNAKEEKKDYSEVKEVFETVLNKYENNPGGKLTRIQYANVCLDSGDYEKAITHYKQALIEFGGNPVLKNAILNGLGYAYEGKGDLKTSVGYFEQITASMEKTFKEDAYYNLGRLYEKMGQKEKSREAYEKIKKDYPDSIYANVVSSKLSG